MKHLKTRDLALCSLFSALMAICAWISIPLGSVSFTLQTFAIFLSLLTLGGKKSTVSVFVYLFLGALGLPVFSGFQGGLSALLGATGGYLWGFLVMALVFWILTALLGEKFRIPAALIGLLLCYACGALWLSFLLVDRWNSELLWLSILPYLVPDAVKLLLALWISRRLRRFINA